jgi:hypothetical protein
MFLLLSAMAFVPGDARVEMKRELAEGMKQHSEVPVIDAFGGDAAPVHLIGCRVFDDGGDPEFAPNGVHTAVKLFKSSTETRGGTR